MKGKTKLYMAYEKVNERLRPLGGIPYWSRETACGRKFSRGEVLLTDLNSHNLSPIAIHQGQREETEKLSVNE